MSPTSPIRSRIAAGALLAVLALFASACGGSGSAGAADDGVATIADDTADETSTDTQTTEDAGDTEDPNAPTDPEDAFALFDECMADAGFDFGGSLISGDDAGGAITITGDDGGTEGDPQSGVVSLDDFDPEEFEEANSACEVHLANLDMDFDLSPEEQARFDDAELEFSKCMEEMGIELPEFEGGSGIVIAGPEIGDDPQSGTPSFDDVDFEELDAAFAECGKIFEELEVGP